REIYLGEWQGLSRAEARERFPEEYASWQTGEDARRGGGETYAEVGARAAACVAEWLEKLGSGGLVVAVTHGGTARATIGTLLEMAPDSWWRLAPLGNCRWSLLGDIGRGWRRRSVTSSPGRLAALSRGCGAVGSALAWHARGQGFESPQLHNDLPCQR